MVSCNCVLISLTIMHQNLYWKNSDERITSLSRPKHQADVSIGLVCVARVYSRMFKIMLLSNHFGMATRDE